MTFMFTYYPQYVQNPQEMIMWLYNYAAYNEEQIRMQQAALQGENVYNTKPRIGGRKVKGKKRNEDEEDLEGDSQFLDMKGLKKQVQGQTPIVQTSEIKVKRPGK